MKEVEVINIPVALTEEQKEELRKLLKRKWNPFKPTEEVIEPETNEVIEEGENNG